MSKSKLRQERALKHRQSDLREVWNRTNGKERMALLWNLWQCQSRIQGILALVIR